MMSQDSSQGNSSHSKGNFFAFERPSLLQDLRNILREYPDNEQIFKELLQNAEDAGAKAVKIFSVLDDWTRQEPKKKKWNRVKATAWRPDFAKMFSMPGLCVYNDALFTDDDWRGIMKLHDSVKVQDPLKVGRFGLGFKSVFHMTDHPIIISGNSLLIMDPIRAEHEAIYKTSIDDLNSDSEEQKMLRRALAPLLKVLAENSLTDERLEGTAFWFPLRQDPSELSETVYTSQRVCDLMQAFRSEINTMPLFLKRLEKIEVFRADGRLLSSPPILEFSVELDEECLAAIRADRKKFISRITTENKACPKKEIGVVSHLSLDTRKLVNGQMEMNKQEWIIVHFHQGTDDMSPELLDLCQRKYLTHRPYVGVAIQLNSPLETFQGQLFSFLPLPPEKPSPTGLPVHIHGFFELSENRRHVDWPKSEEENYAGPKDEKLVWNRLLVEEVLPRAYIKLVSDLVASERAFFGKASPEQGTDIDRVARLLYELCPNPDNVTSHCLSLLTPFYQKLSSCRLFFTNIKGGQWVFLTDAVVMASPVGGTLKEAAEEAVAKVYEVCEVNLVRLPSHVVQGLQRAICQNAEDKADSNFNIVCQENLISLMKGNKSWVDSISGKQKCLILDYLCLHDEQLFEELELLPLADGSFCSFCDHKVYVCRDEQELSLFPRLLGQLCYVTEPAGLEKHLRRLASSEFGNLQLIADTDIPALLDKNLKYLQDSFNNISVPLGNPWMKQVWDYLQGQELREYDHLPLLPCLYDKTLLLKPIKGNYLCAKLQGFPHAPQALVSALGHLGVCVIPSLPDFLRHADIVHRRVQPPSCLGVLKCLARLADSSETLETAVKAFNSKSSPNEREALADIVADGKDHDEWTAAMAVLCRLELFPLWPGCMERASKTKSSTVKYISVQDNCKMTPDTTTDQSLPPPVSFSVERLHCFTRPQRQLALHLEAEESSLRDIVMSTLQALMDKDHEVTNDYEVVEFITYCLQSPLFEDSELRDLARQVHCVPSCLTGELRKPGQVYDPESHLLQELFVDEDKFPEESFCRNSILQSLRQIGLRSDADVADDDLLQTATMIHSLCETSQISIAPKRKANALWQFLKKMKNPDRVLSSLASLRCLPCVNVREDAPSDYPSRLPLCPEEYRRLGISSAGDMCSHADFKIISSVKPVSLPVDPNHPVHKLFFQPTPAEIIRNLTIVTSAFEKKESLKFASVLDLIYSKLNMMRIHDSSVCMQLKGVECIRTEKDGCFRIPSKFWAGEEDSDVDLSPYRFRLPAVFAEELSGLFVACGCSQLQDCAALRDVLCEMQTKHRAPSTEDWIRDFKLARAISKAIVKKGEPDDDRGGTLLPVYTSQKGSLQFALATDCTVAPDLEVIELLTEDEEEESLTFVHPDFDKDIALKLGALDLATKTKAGVNDLPLDDSNFGQYVSLTTFLRNLLREGYTDGFSVPKELIQNADDAGATVVKFLVDERENRECRTGLQPPALADFQGAALWVYNDAEFTSTDFNNLCKVAGATKKEDCSKVGKFGLGFSAVYNITEIPSIYSGNTLAMLDPHEKYLLDNKPGKKMDLNSITNRAFLRRLPNQFRPFQGVFGCDILSRTRGPFDGTLFRFPFRTESQAEKSSIRMEAFTSEDRNRFVEQLKSNGGNLLLFLQNVTRLELHRLPSHCTEPSQAECLMILERSSVPETPSPKSSVLRHVSDTWRNAVERSDPLPEQKIVETVTVSMETNQRQECMFRVAWATGQEESCAIAKEKAEEGFIPLAAVGISIGKGGNAVPIEKSAKGFYSDGHLFCFLPLAQQVSQSKLFVHINAPFALRSDRKSLLTETDDDVKISTGGRWNKALFQDPIPRAYLFALESVAHPQTPPELYYGLWPTLQRGERGHPQSEMCPNFYRLLIQKEGPKVFLSEAGCCRFSDSFFFYPDFKETRDGKVAFQVLKKFWKETEWRGYLIDLPVHVSKDIRASGQESAFMKNVITKEEFFVNVLFPKITEENTSLTANERDCLVLNALLSDSTKLHELIKSNACIPCRPAGCLQRPKQLIHPECRAASLFAEADALFPHADFSSSSALKNLMNLGMKDTVSSEQLVERAFSLRGLPQHETFQRVQAIVRYLPSLEKCISNLSDVEFLPVEKKPKNWPLQWFGEGRKLEAPSRAFSKDLKELVGCKASVLQEEPLNLSNEDWDILKKLGAIHLKADGDTRLTEITVAQLMSISAEYRKEQHSEESCKVVEGICRKIYKYLDTCHSGAGKQVKKHKEIMEKLKEQPVVLTNQGFQKAERLAMGHGPDLEPYLVYVDGNSLGCAKFFSFLGIKDAHGVPEILAAMKQLATDLCSQRLTDRHLKCILDMAGLLRDGLSKRHLSEEEIMGLFLPDSHNMLRPVTELCLNDCDWLTESDTMHFLHPKFSEDLALAFGVRTKREHDEDEFCEPFGQQEKLTTRINSLLKGYTRDISIFQELVQNADDAGASEIRFVKDLRRHNTEQLLNEGWKEVFGPALCVYNDACFTPNDMQGIQDLGEGSKEADTFKTGKFGVGFNSVYNLTDTPCFWTRVEPEHGDTSQVPEKLLGEKLCLLDPNFFVASVRSKMPGQRLCVNDRFRDHYSNMLSPFALDEQSTQNQTGTVFRLPLRTEEKAVESKIKQVAVNMTELQNILQDFQAVMGECLLFLKNVKKIGVYTAKEDGTIEKEYETQLTADELNMRKHQEFFEHVKNEAKKLKNESLSLRAFTSKEIAMECCLSSSDGSKEEWLVVHRFGLSDNVNIPCKLEQPDEIRQYKLLPVGGVALCLSLREDVCSSQSALQGKSSGNGLDATTTMSQDDEDVCSSQSALQGKSGNRLDTTTTMSQDDEDVCSSQSALQGKSGNRLDATTTMSQDDEDVCSSQSALQGKSGNRLDATSTVSQDDEDVCSSQSVLQGKSGNRLDATTTMSQDDEDVCSSQSALQGKSGNSLDATTTMSQDDEDVCSSQSALQGKSGNSLDATTTMSQDDEDVCSSQSVLQGKSGNRLDATTTMSQDDEDVCSSQSVLQGKSGNRLDATSTVSQDDEDVCSSQSVLQGKSGNRLDATTTMSQDDEDVCSSQSVMQGKSGNGLDANTTMSQDEEMSGASPNKAAERRFKAFCMLPLTTVRTGLPVHVNGRFALNHETRADIITQQDKNMYTWNRLLADSVVVPAYVTALCHITRLCFLGEDTTHSGNLSLRTCSNPAKTLSHYSNFFPDHRVEMDCFWKSLMISFYKHLAVTEANVFPAVRKDLNPVLWVPAVKSTGFSGYFINDEINFHLKQVLVNLNMNIIECPFKIYEDFVKSEVTSVKSVNEETVAGFLRSCRDESSPDSCNLKHLPKNVKDTAFRCLADVVEVFNFLRMIPNFEGLPLSLRMSHQLHVFDKQQPTTVSTFCGLLPSSSELFLHERLVTIVSEKLLIRDQLYLKKLDIKTLAEQLPYTLDQSVFGCGKTLLLNEISPLPRLVPSLSAWIRKIWELFELLLINEVDGSLDPVKEWSFIPAFRDIDNQVCLFPFKEKDHVVYIPPLPSDYGYINAHLARLPLNRLHGKFLPEKSKAGAIVASVMKPEGLLTALASLQYHPLNSNEAQDILHFFYTRFDKRVEKYVSAIRSLPFFERHDGSFSAIGTNHPVLCLKNIIPQNGLKDWCSSCCILLLKENIYLKELFEQLEISCPGTEQFYLRYLLPGIRLLPADSIPHHMECIRICCFSAEVISFLCKTPFIRGVDGTLSLASSFYSPYCKVFTVMMTHDQFPPPPYIGIHWREFLEKVGMVTEVSEDKFLQFARQVEESGRSLIQTTLKQQSQELVQYLKHSHSLREKSFLKHLKIIKFLVPQLESELEQGALLQLIHPLFKPPSPLVSFAESLPSDHCFLVWSSSCILPIGANSSQFKAWEPDMYDWIGFKKEPPLDLVVKHIVNVCEALNGKGTSQLSSFHGKQIDTVEKIMEAIYEHLMKVQACGQDNELEPLKSVAVILDKKSKAMLYPNQVIIGLRPEEIIEGHVMCAPEELGKFFSLFRELGVHDRVRLNHYARALESINTQTHGDYLNPNELKLVASAVDNLFKLLKHEPNDDSLSVPKLYLPGKEIMLEQENIQGNVPLVMMVASKELILEVSQTHQRRLKTVIKGLHVFVNFDELLLESHDLHQEADLLPEGYRMQKWHSVVKETVQESCRCLASSDANTQCIEEQIHSSEFVLVVKRLVNHQKVKKRQKFTEDDATDIEKKLNNITVCKTTNLQTVLTLKGSEMPDTVEKRKFFVERSGKDSSIEKVFLYIDSQEIASDLSKIMKVLMPFIHRAVEWAVGCPFPVELDYCFENLLSATQIMDYAEIIEYEFRHSTSIAFPPPGSFVPDELHFMLDQDVYEFKVSEVVAHELHDPVLLRQTPGGEEGTLDSSSADSDVRKPTYIFAKVLKVIEAPAGDGIDTRTRLLLLRYVIDVGRDEDKEVEACELYKFIRPEGKTTSLVPFEGSASLPECSDNLKETLKDIRRQLRNIWRTLQDQKSRMRAVKRLYLKWHPDKNPDRRDFCTKIFQKIMDYVNILQGSGKLDSDDEDDVDSRSFRDRSSGSGSYWSTFFDDLFSRAASYGESSRSYRSGGKRRRGHGWSGGGGQGGAGFCFSWSGGGSSQANPQPTEGKRWMRQAEKDLEAARETLQHVSAAFNWTCYQAHQAAEKALKAVLYHRDASLDCRNSHSLGYIAGCVADDCVQGLSKQLEKALGHHTRMRYPGFSHDYPKIPSECYSESNGAEAVTLAEEIVKQAQILLGIPSRRPSPPPQPQPRRTSPPRRRNPRSQRLTASPARPQISGSQSLQIAAPSPASPVQTLLALPPP